MLSDKNVWFINFSGIGNGIVIAPILRCFEESHPSTFYFHSENQALADQWFIEKAGLKNLKGFNPIEWRRFEEKHWNGIIAFIKTNRIGTIVNLRNEGPRYDVGYYRFKETISGKQLIAFWDLDFATIGARLKQGNITKDILSMLASRSIDVSRYNPRWLSSIRGDGTNSVEIGFCMAAGQKNKRWLISKWIELGRKIIASLPYKIILFPGIAEGEVKCAEDVRQAIGTQSCELIYCRPLSEVAIRIGKLGCFVSNDTGLLHVAVAIGVPSVGLYTSTNADVWAPYVRDSFVACQNSFIWKCPAQKAHCGNCFHYYDTCPAVAGYRDDINPSEVYEIIAAFLDKAPSYSHSTDFVKS